MPVEPGGIMRVHLAVLSCAAAMLALIAIPAVGQKPDIKTATAPPTSAASGAEMYASYCAACHGKEGKGNGPAAPALKVPPPDLTTLTRRNGGKFPGILVAHTIAGEGNLSAHGSKDMPVWGPVFRALSRGDQAIVQMRTTNLTKYVESLQVK
jgi:mono/diheme cytochrome c family protein